MDSKTKAPDWVNSAGFGVCRQVRHYTHEFCSPTRRSFLSCRNICTNAGGNLDTEEDEMQWKSVVAIAVIVAGVSAQLSAGLPPVALMTDDGAVQLGLGALSLGLVYPGLFDEPLEVVLGARARTAVAIEAGDLAFGDIVIEELYFSTGEVSLDARTRDIVEDFLIALIQRLVDSALNDALTSRRGVTSPGRAIETGDGPLASIVQEYVAGLVSSFPARSM